MQAQLFQNVTNPTPTSEYLLRLFEQETSNVIQIPSHITPMIREQTIIWIFELAEYLKIQPRTKHLAVSILDRGLAFAQSSDLQLLACLSLAISLKIEETKVLTLMDLSKLTHFKYSPKDISEAELALLQKLKWKVDSAVAIDFAAIFSDLLLEDNPEAYGQLVQSLEFCVSEAQFLHYKPSTLAMACLIELFTGAGFQEGVDASLLLINQWGPKLKYEEVKACCEVLQGFLGKEEPRTPEKLEEEREEVSTVESKGFEGN